MKTNIWPQIFLAAFLPVAAALWFCGCSRPAAKAQGELCFGIQAAGAPSEVSIPIESGFKLDGMTKKQVYDLRRHYISLRPELIGPGYEPKNQIFGGIMDGKPWWGIEGIYIYGGGARSTEGYSEESRFLANPFLLVALREPLAVNSGRSDAVVDDMPTPNGLIWNCASSWAHANYEVSPFFNFTESLPGYPEEWDHMLWIVAYNARDLGFNYLYLDPDLSENVRKRGNAVDPEGLGQFVHHGGSCGYPGGCNNMSPAGDGMYLHVDSLPAKAVFKLWRERPPFRDALADATFTIDLR